MFLCALRGGRAGGLGLCQSGWLAERGALTKGGWFKIIGVVGCAGKAGTAGAGPESWATVGIFSHVSFSDVSFSAGVGGALTGCWLEL